MHPSNRSNTKHAWLWGMLAATVLWVFLFACCGVRFVINDDQFLLRAFMGTSPGGPTTFQYFVTGLYCYPLAWLGRLFPGIAWFSIVEIVLMWLSSATIFKSILQCFARQKHPHLGVFTGVCFLLLFQLYYGARLTFTTVAASLGAACVAQILSVDCIGCTNRQILRSMGFALALLVLCYGLRPVASLSALAFCGVAYLLRLVSCFGKESKRSTRPMILVLVLVGVVMGGLVALREVEIDAVGQREHVEWDAASTDVMDFLNLSTIPPEARVQAGWSDTQVDLLSNWYTMEEAISTESFQTIVQYRDQIVRRATPGVAVFKFRTQSPVIAFSLVVLFALGVCCLIGLTLRRKGLWTFLALLCTAGGCLLLLAYLALQGRLPYRAVMVTVLPAAALVFCLIPECLPQKRLFALCLCVVLTAVTFLYARPILREVWSYPPQNDGDIYAAMDALAVKRPDQLFVYDGQLVSDMRIFPDFSRGIPTNLMFWGGWQRGLSDYQSKLAAFGMDGDHFTAGDWLNPAIRYLTLHEVPSGAFIQHLRQELGESLTWEQEKLDGSFYAYRFHLAQ